MAFFTNPTSKLEQAVRMLIILQGKGSMANSFISNDSRCRVLPNRTFVVTAFTPVKPYRPEGVCILDIEHHFPALVQPNQTDNQGRKNFNAQQDALNSFFGDTMDTLNLGGDNEQDMQPLASAITAAGRWMAQTDNTPSGDQFASDNAEMANFRCDWVKFSIPSITRGKPDSESVNWAEVIHLQAYVSHAST
jgi:hypothetical protein